MKTKIYELYTSPYAEKIPPFSTDSEDFTNLLNVFSKHVHNFRNDGDDREFIVEDYGRFRVNEEKYEFDYYNGCEGVLRVHLQVEPVETEVEPTFTVVEKLIYNSNILTYKKQNFSVGFVYLYPGIYKNPDYNLTFVQILDLPKDIECLAEFD